MISNLKKKIKKRNGFSIIEMIVILAIISIGMIGVLSLVVQSMQIEYINKSTLIASQLAQEGLELVRNKRDNNWLWMAAWDNGLASGTYKIDNTSMTSATMATAGLNVDGNGFYTHQAGAASIYKRTVTLVNTPPDHITVQSRVYWTEKGRDHYYVADTILYDWK